jgi:hypothetical protein
MDSLFFTLEDVREIRKVSVNIDDFDMFAREVQRNYVQKLLGARLYSALQVDLVAGEPQAARFVELIDGLEYTVGSDLIIYRGMKVYCSYLWLYLYTGMGDVNHTPIGSRLFTDAQSEMNEASQTLRNSKDHYIKSADQMEEPILEFLRDNRVNYPEFIQSNQVEQAKRDNITFRAMGRTITDPYNRLY